MFKTFKFTSKVTIAASLVLVMVLGLFTINNFISMRNQTQIQLTAVLQEISQSVSQNIANWLNDRLQVVESVASGHRKSDSEQQILRRLKTADVAGDFKNVYVGMPSGKFVLDDPSIQLPSDYDATTRPWYKLAQSKRSTAFTNPYIDVTTNELTISAVVPMFDGGAFSGVAGGDIDMKTITGIISEIDFLGFGYAFLLDKEGRILSHPAQNYNDKPMADLFGRKIALNDEFVELEIDGQEKLVSFIEINGIKNVDWYLGVVINKEIAYSSVSSFRNMAAIYMILGVVVIVVMLQILLKYLMRPVVNLNDAIKDIAQGEGDLTRRLNVENDDEFGELSSYFNLFIAKIHDSIVQVRDTTVALEHSVEHLVKQTQSTLDMYGDQSKRTDNVATAINELSSSAVEISNNATHASELASEANQLSADSQTALNANITEIASLSDKMSKAQSTVDSLDKHSASIGQVLEVIKSVSEQTNLLALNAAIEAARAGEAGRGFAVVADEVRQLAQRTQESTQEIENTIGELQQGSASAVAVMNLSLEDSAKSASQATEAGHKMTEVSSAIESIDGVNHAVASATAEQNSVIQSLDSDIHHISDLSVQGAENLNGTLSECRQLQAQFDELEKMVLKFKV
ncbi:methyl-accepting chemotaxis protein [Pseudoalteromonas citrea]|uniref:Methyl-accepting chemotaxis protein n=1 Tax=Pseudoalteromonas citrea TaxID=43655 RepID=A0A5S3XQA9_9GAMM|nr:MULTISPECIES: methyl-accepting chemotaxis protein [Pseudoalteromonas]RJE72334.1 chemotaxis protein [Pseudoalteromonas sp. MSK9-3]TMP44512.1 methyl-accepting chemotaxis protein [Pseudoalteromonas citrea]TMP59586.1 methyl-accepting chemotaxis protein [Pseudoalteromonas citrea]